MCCSVPRRSTTNQAVRSTSRSPRSAGCGAGPAATTSCPDPARLAEARPLVGSDKMVLDPKARTVQLKKPGMKLDVGGHRQGLRRPGGPRRAQEGRRHAGPGGRSRGHRGRRSAARMPVAGRSPSRRWNRARRVLTACSCSGQRGRLDRRRCRAVRGHRRPSLLPYHQSGDRARVSKIAPASRSSRRRRDGRCSRDDRLHPGPERGLKLVDETPGAAAIFVRLTPDGSRRSSRRGSSRFRRSGRLRRQAWVLRT